MIQVFPKRPKNVGLLESAANFKLAHYPNLSRFTFELSMCEFAQGKDFSEELKN